MNPNSPVKDSHLSTSMKEPLIHPSEDINTSLKGRPPSKIDLILL